MTLYERFCALPIDRSCINFARGDEAGGYWCTPVGMRVLGWENGGIHYGIIDGCGETIFAVNPEPLDFPVCPLAKNFEDFLRLILAAGGTTAIEQIANWDRAAYDAFRSDENEVAWYNSDEVQSALRTIERELGLAPMEDAFGYVKALQAGFDRSVLRFSAEYYDALGLEMPE